MSHIAHHETAQAGLFTAIDPEVEELRRKRTESSGTRAAAYEILQLSEIERAALEWASVRGQSRAFDELQKFYDAADQVGQAQAADWLNGSGLQGDLADGFRKAIAATVAAYEEWQKGEQFADRAENAVLWVLRLSAAGIALFSLFHYVMRYSGG